MKYSSLENPGGENKPRPKRRWFNEINKISRHLKAYIKNSYNSEAKYYIIYYEIGSFDDENRKLKKQQYNICNLKYTLG